MKSSMTDFSHRYMLFFFGSSFELSSLAEKGCVAICLILGAWIELISRLSQREYSKPDSKIFRLKCCPSK